MASFQAAVELFAKNTKATGTQVMKKIGFDLLAEIVRRTPIDTGRARASWQISVNRVRFDVAPERLKRRGQQRDSAGRFQTNTDQSANSRSAAAMSSYRWGDEIYISNNLPYIEALEGGHSRQAGPGVMMKGSIRKIEADLDRIIRQSRSRFFK